MKESSSAQTDASLHTTTYNLFIYGWLLVSVHIRLSGRLAKAYYRRPLNQQCPTVLYFNYAEQT